MGKTSTRLKIAFFSILLAAFIVIQYCWVITLQKDKSAEFKSRLISGINSAGEQITTTGSLYTLTAPALANLLRQGFANQDMGNIRFEFSIDVKGRHLASPGFHPSQPGNSGNLTLYYLLQHSNDVLTVVVPGWNIFVWKKMPWTIAASVLLTMMIMVLFYFATILTDRIQQSFYDNRTIAIKNMMRHLEVPLSTISVAAEALRNARVMQDAAQINYYQRIINEESQRMNEQLKQFMQELK